MDIYTYILIISIIVIIFYIYIIYTYYSTNKQLSYAMPKWIEYIFRPELHFECSYDIQELSTLLFIAIETIRTNFDIIKSDDITQYEPHVLITRYPFYKQIFAFMKYVYDKKCIDSSIIYKVLYSLYGNDLRASPELHVYREGIRYYVIINFNEIMQYYSNYIDKGIDNIISY